MAIFIKIAPRLISFTKIDKWSILVMEMGVRPIGYPDRQSLFLPAHFGGPADGPTMPLIGTLARLIIKYPAC